MVESLDLKLINVFWTEISEFKFSSSFSLTKKRNEAIYKFWGIYSNIRIKEKVFLLSSFIKFRLLIELKYQYLKNLFLSFRIDKEKCKFYHSIHLKVLNLTQFRSITQQKMSNQDSIYWRYEQFTFCIFLLVSIVETSTKLLADQKIFTADFFYLLF